MDKNLCALWVSFLHVIKHYADVHQYYPLSPFSLEQNAINAVQADVDTNESDADAAINLRALAADSILTGITEAKGKLHVGNE